MVAGSLLVFVAAWLISRKWQAVDVRYSDVPLYREYGEAFLRGSVPYEDFALEYPPGALLAFVPPAAASTTLHGYQLAFDLLVLACGCALILALASSLRALRATPTHFAGALLVAALVPLLLGRVVFERFDLLAAAFVAVAIAASLAERHLVAASMLALGTAVKLFPVVLLPFFLVFAYRRCGARKAATAAVSFVGVVFACSVPFLILNSDGFFDALERQARRPLQIESAGASVLLVAHHLAGIDLGVEASYGSINLGGARADVLSLASSVVLLALLLALVWRYRLWGRDKDGFVLAVAAALATVVAFAKVLSPQFLVWPLAAVVLVRGALGVAATGLLTAALVVTQSWFPGRYQDLIDLHRAPIALVALRNLLLAALAVLLGGALIRGSRRVPER